MHKRKSTPWGRRRRRVYLILALLLLLVSPYLIWRLGPAVAIRKELSAMRAEGLPTTEEERQRWLSQFPLPRLVPEYDAVYAAYVNPPIEVVAAMPSFKTRHESPELFAVPYDEITLATLSQAVALNAESLRLLAEARQAATGHCAIRYRPIDEFITLCCAQACVKAEQGDGAAAMDSILDGLALLKVAIAKLWSRSLVTSGDSLDELMRALASAACRVSLPEEKLREVQAMLAAPAWAEEERNRRIDWLAEYVSNLNDDRRIVYRREHPFEVLIGWVERSDLWHIRGQRLSIALMGKTVSEHRAACEALGDEYLQGVYQESGAPVGMVVATAGIEVICHYQKTGSLPESLDALAREGLDLKDFYSEKPLVYKGEASSFTIYSIGRDLRDDAGSGRDDVVFQAVLPAKVGTPASL